MTSVVTQMNAFAEARAGDTSRPIQRNAMSPNNVRIGNRLRIARVSHGISEKEFSEKLGIDLDDLSLYEAGEKRINANLMFRIARVLDAQLKYFFQDYAKAGL